MRACALSLGLLALFAGEACTQWGGGRCGPVGPRLHATTPYAPQREWRQLDLDPGRWHLFVAGRQVGGYCSVEDIYRALGPHGWEPPSRPPEDLPAAARAATKKTLEPVTQNFGVEVDRLPASDAGNHYSLDGRPVTRAEAFEALQKGQLADDTKKKRLTFIGSKTDCEQALATLPEDFKAKYLVQTYRPDHWAVANAGFRTDGTPTVYFQEPPNAAGQGYVLWREGSVTANTWASIRRADPDYKPDNDPGPHKPKPAPVPTPGPGPQPLPFDQIPPGTGLLAGLAALALYFHRRHS